MPGVDAWFARGAAPDAVRRTLLATLPDDLDHPAGLLSYRLTRLLPPPLPAGPSVPAPDPLQLCDTCEEVAFRAPEPGPCPRCREDAAPAARAARPVPHCVACALLVRERREARERCDRGAETDANVLMRRHLAREHP